MFDDFSYATTGSPAANGWSIRGEGGSPGPAGSAFDPSLVSFSESGGQTVMQLDAVTDGTPAGTRQAEIASPEKYLEGTYAARVYFTDRPAGGGTGSKINQTFFTINGEDGSGYSELDFEYLSAGGWGSSGPTMFETSWATPGDPVSDQQGSSLAGWHDLAMTVTGGTVTYLVDGQPVARHSGEHYPDSPMAIDFNQWFLSLAPDGLDGPGAWTMQVDYVLFAGGEALSPARIDSAVAAYRATGVAFTDTVG